MTTSLLRNLKKWKWLSVLLCGSFLFLYFLLCSWNFDIGEYPDADATPYALPIRSNSTTFCIQGNNTVCTHKEKYKYSFDFLLFPGTEIFAARGGTVTKVLNSVKGIGFFKGNYVGVFHDDGTMAIYAHLRYQGAIVNVGDSVNQGQLLGYSGCTGQSIYPHLHFHVETTDKSMPISFNNIGKDKGVPRFLHTYTAE